MAGAYPHAKDEVCFYARKIGHLCHIDRLDKDGNVLYKTNKQTGNIIYNDNGEAEALVESVEFTQWRTKFSQDGYTCVKVVKAKPTIEKEKRILAMLLEDAKDRGSEVMDEKAYLSQVNPELAKKLADDEENEKLHIKKDETIKAKDAEIAELRRKIGGGNQGSNK